MSNTRALFESFQENLKMTRDTISDIDFSVNSGVVDGDIPEFEAKYNIKITNITEPDAHHNAVYSIEGKAEDVQRFKDDVFVEAEEPTVDNSEKIANLKMMDKVIRRLNDEEYLLDTWLSLGVPDEASEEDYESIAQDGYEEVEKVFADILKSVVANGDELFNPPAETLEFARRYEPEIKVLEEPRQVLGEDSYETADDIKAGVEKSGGLYQFIYDEWHNLPEEMKKEIALNAVYELNNDAKILEDLAERLSESMQNYSPDEDDLIDDEEDDEYYSPDDDPQGGMRYSNF